jgi:hypothetical protein
MKEMVDALGVEKSSDGRGLAFTAERKFASEDPS